MSISNPGTLYEPGRQGDSWISENSLLMAILWPVLLVAIFLPLSVRTYRELSRQGKPN